MPRFIKTDDADLGTKRVVLSVRRSPAGQIVGRIVALAVTHAGLTPETTAPDDPPIAEALRQAGDLAASISTDVDVVDPDGLWQPSWGVLEDRGVADEVARPSEGAEVVEARDPPPIPDRKPEDLPNLGGVID